MASDKPVTIITEAFRYRFRRPCDVYSCSRAKRIGWDWCVAYDCPRAFTKANTRGWRGVLAGVRRALHAQEEAVSNRIVIESPLKGDHIRNFRFLLWCCRAVWLKDGKHAIASHMLCPWFMDDSKQNERDAGIDWEWMWGPTAPHWFFCDFGFSSGMTAAKTRRGSLPSVQLTLKDYHPESWAAFVRGEWPPHTAGFEVSASQALIA